MSIIVRPAVESDLDEVGRITVDAYTAGPGAGTREYVARLRDARTRLDDAELYVAELDGVIAGSITLARPGELHSEIAHGNELEVRYLSVDPSLWGHGVAKELMAKARDVAAAEHRVLVLDVIDHNTKAHDMYTKLGFVRVPKRDFFPIPNVDLKAYVDGASPFYRDGVHESGIS
jgi:GNAT superfamily N-acetyltransferase